MLFTADEAFFTGTAMEMVPIREVNKRTIGDGKPGSLTKKLMTEFQKVIENPKAAQESRFLTVAYVAAAFLLLFLLHELF